MNEYNENFEMHGPWERYYKNGQLRYRQIWLNGELNGPYESYYDKIGRAHV